MKKILTYINYLFIAAILPACNEQIDETPDGESALFHINHLAGKELGTPVDYYIFKENTLYETGQKNASTFTMSVAENSQVFFFAGEKKPAGLLSAEKGKTTISEFEGIRTDPDTPLFYSGSLHRTEQSIYNVPLTIGEARIDLDATYSDLLKINAVRITNAPTSSLIFPTATLVTPPATEEKRCEFDSPMMGKREDIARLYESGVPVNFIIEGEYNKIPISFDASLQKVARNTKYTLKVINAGGVVSGEFKVDEWSQTDTVNTGIHADEKLIIDMEHSTFPEGTVVTSGKQSLTVPYTGGDISLAFLAESEVDFESIVDELNHLTVSEGSVSRDNDKILTTFLINVKGQEENTLPYTTQLNVKSAFRNYSTNSISLTIDCPPLYIREVTLGGVTWMAFNARSRDMDDQVYPMKGYNVEEMYNNEWLSTLGGLFQYGRNYRYEPWESGINNQGNQTGEISWGEAANTPCPEGYRIPTNNELRALFGDCLSPVPGSWNYNGEHIVASEVTASHSSIDINNVKGVAKYLKLAGSRGQCMYIPYGGMKAAYSPSAADPKFEQGFRLWSSEETENGSGISIFYGNLATVETHIKSFRSAEVDPESYAYVRCIKINK